MSTDPRIVDGVRAVLQEHLGVSGEISGLRQEVATLVAITREVVELQRREATAREATLALAQARREEEHATLAAREASMRRWGVGLAGLGALLAGAIAVAREIIGALKGTP